MSRIDDLLPELPTPVTVRGDGELAERLRARLAATPAGARPATVIDTIGTAESLTAAFEEVDDLGVVVSAAPQPAETVDLDLYGDLHVRGITLKTLAP